MNTLILGLVLFFGATDTNAVAEKDYSWVIDDMQGATELYVDNEFTQNRIKIFDLNGNLLGQYNQEAFIKNSLPLADLRRIQDSEFLFESQGDSYYLTD